MVSLSTPVRLILVKASSTVMYVLRSTYSIVIMLPAESSGYLSISFMLLRIFGSVCCSILLTTVAGISSMMSTASSTYSSSRTSLSSVSLKALMSISCASESIFTNTSAASSFGNIRYKSGSVSSGTSVSIDAISASFISERSFLSSE